VEKQTNATNLVPLVTYRSAVYHQIGGYASLQDGVIMCSATGVVVRVNKHSICVCV
jgi:hypothetical protein